ncbi:transposase [Plantactinospora sp. DSM 117369]
MPSWPKRVHVGPPVVSRPETTHRYRAGTPPRRWWSGSSAMPSITRSVIGESGRPPAFDKVTYRRRNVVERCFNRLKQWRDLATRYAKRASLYRASLVLIAATIWLA